MSPLLSVITVIMSPLLRSITVIMSPLLHIITRSIIRNNGFIIKYYRPGQLGDAVAAAAAATGTQAGPSRVTVPAGY